MTVVEKLNRVGGLAGDYEVIGVQIVAESPTVVANRLKAKGRAERPDLTFDVRYMPHNRDGISIPVAYVRSWTAHSLAYCRYRCYALTEDVLPLTIIGKFEDFQ